MKLSMLKLKNSLAFRSGGIYKFLVKFLPPPTFINHPKSQLIFISMCGKKHLDLLNQCLQTLHQTWKVIPKLQIYSDGTVEVCKILKTLSWWKGEKEILNWDICFADSPKSTFSNNLLQFAQNNPIGKKLAVILLSGRNNPILWCDTDILWFSQLPELDVLLNLRSNIVIKASRDFQPAYGCFVNSLPHLKEFPYINTGLVYLNGDVFDSVDLNHLLEKAVSFSDHFTEQAILAELIYQIGLPCWTLEEIFCGANDNQTLNITYKSKSWIARHYVGSVRHLFWRDALASRLGIKQKL